MENEELNREFYHLIVLLEVACRNYREQSAKGIGPSEPEQQQARYLISGLMASVLSQYDQTVQQEVNADALIRLMDAYEISQNEIQLQTVLSLAEKLLPELPSSPLKCKLLSYCYFYVEEPECAREARRILDSWDKSCYDEERTEAAEFYFSMVK